MKVPTVNQETVHGNRGLESVLKDSLQYSSNVSTGYIPGEKWYVNGSVSATGHGDTWDSPFKTIAEAITAASARDIIYIAPKTITDFTGDPTSYEENLTIPATKPHLALIGVSLGLTQGGLPQLKDGTVTTQHILRIRAAGCLIANLGFNGAGNTGGGILLDDDYSTKTAFGTTIVGCHFKNCKGTTATNAATGGAINWTSAGNAWQVRIEGNRFYKNVGDIVLPGTTSTVPQDVVIKGNVFSGPAASVDCNLYLKGAGSGMNGVLIDQNIFQQLPAIGSGSNARFGDLTGCVGMMTRNFFGALTAEGETEVTFEAAGTAMKIPTTVHMAGNYGAFNTGVGAGLVSGEIFG